MIWIKRIFPMAWSDLRIMVGDKVFFFRTLGFPIFFIVLFGLLYNADGNAAAVAELTVVNLDERRWGGYFVEKIKSPGIELLMTEKASEEYSRPLIIPSDFSARIEARRHQVLEFKKRFDASTKPPPAWRPGCTRPSPA